MAGLDPYVLHEDRAVDALGELGKFSTSVVVVSAPPSEGAPPKTSSFSSEQAQGDGVSGGAGADDDDLTHVAHTVVSGFVGAISSIRPSTSFLISSRIGRTASTPWPAGSSSAQSR